MRSMADRTSTVVLTRRPTPSSIPTGGGKGNDGEENVIPVYRRTEAGGAVVRVGWWQDLGA
jgi:hypothetical protein